MARIYNQATLSYSGKQVNSNIVTGEILEPLEVNKTPLETVYRQGQIITFSVNFRNYGLGEFRDLKIEDDLGAFVFTPDKGVPFTVYPLHYVRNTVRYIQNGVLQNKPNVSDANNKLTISGITVPPAGVVTILYDAEVTVYAPLNKHAQVNNQVTVTGGGLMEPIIKTASIRPATRADLRIVKALRTPLATDNGRLFYTFTIENFGNDDAGVTANVSIEDRFNPMLTDLTVQYNGAPWSASNYEYRDGVFTTVKGRITVDAADFVLDETTGVWRILSKSAVLTVSGVV